MYKLLLILSCITSITLANNNMSNMDMSHMKGMASGTHMQMKQHNMKNMESKTTEDVKH